jgi:hypothetical protein
MSSPTETVLLLAFGQSNADVHVAGPRVPSDLWEDPEVVVPDDRWGIRGLLGRDEQKEIPGFVPAWTIEPNNQSLLLAAATRLRQEHPNYRVIIRSVAKGGRTLRGLIPKRQPDRVVEGLYTNMDGSKSMHFHNLVRTLREARRAAEVSGPPVTKTVILWLHGESDRALSLATYEDSFTQLIKDVETESGFDDLKWYTVQPGGTGPGGGGNDWPNRLALMSDKVQALAPLIGAGYVCEYFDQSHYSAKGKLFLGEWLGHIVSRHLRGDDFRLMPAPSVTLIDPKTVEVTFAQDIQTVDQSPEIEGFTLGMKGRQLEILSIERLSANKLRIVSVGDMTTKHAVSVNYAYRKNFSKTPTDEVGHAFGTGNLRTSYETASVLAPGHTLFEPVPGFSVPVMV